jgi:O-antigen/teichoic acid export membrane protein
LIAVSKKIIASFNNKAAILFSSSSVILSLVKLVSGVVIIKWVLPEDIGLWNSISLIQSYTAILTLGMLSGLNRELPYYMGKGDQDYIIKLAQTTLYFVRILNVVISIVTVLALIYIYFFVSQNIELLFGIFSIGIIITTAFYNTYLSVTYRASSEFVKLSKMQLYISGFTLITVILPYYYSYYGLVIRTVLISIFSVAAIYVVRPLKVKAAFDKKSFKELIKTGIQLYAIGYLDDIGRTFNRTILLSYGGVIMVGYFSPAIAIITGMAILPGAMAQYIYPQMSFNFGKFNDPGKLWGWVWKSALGMFAIGLPLILMGWLLIPYFIKTFFPNYLESTFATQMALVSGVFDSATIGTQVLNTLKSFKWLTILTVFKLALLWVAMNYFASSMNPLEGVAIGMVIASVIIWIVSMLICYRVTHTFSFKRV